MRGLDTFFADAWRQVESWLEARAAERPRGPRLRYEENGRSGKIHVAIGASRFSLYWEFGGADVLLTITVPTEREWQSRTRLPRDSRKQVLRFIAQQVIRDKTSTGRNRYEIGPSQVVIFDWSPPPSSS
jgi:hypothetical protein